MQQSHQLNEKHKRLYAAVEALKVGHGGIFYIAKLVGCNRKTIARGLRELATLNAEESTKARVRQAGGGRKPL